MKIDGNVRTDNGDSWMIDAAQIGGPLVAFVALLLLGMQISRTRKDTQGQRAFDMHGRYTSREFRSLASKASAFLDAEDAGDCVQKLRAWMSSAWADECCLPRTPRGNDAKPAINDIQQVLGFFEGVGTLYNRADLTREVILKSFPSPPVQFMTEGWWFICWRRGGMLLGEPNTKLYEQFELFVRGVREKEPDAVGDMKPNDKIQIICLPTDLHEPDNAHWKRCEDLSLRLSALVRHNRQGFIAAMTRLADEIAALDPNLGGKPFTISLLPIPCDIDVWPEDWWPVRKAVKDMVPHLNAIGTARVDALIARLRA